MKARVVLSLATALPALPAVLLDLAAGSHARTLSSPAYTSSELIGVEVALVALTLLALLLQGPLWIALGVMREWRVLAVAFASALLALMCLVVAFVIDAATLLYAT